MKITTYFFTFCVHMTHSFYHIITKINWLWYFNSIISSKSCLIPKSDRSHCITNNNNAWRILSSKNFFKLQYCVEIVQIRSFFWSVFSVFQKIRTRKNSVFGHFSHSANYQYIRQFTTTQAYLLWCFEKSWFYDFSLIRSTFSKVAGLKLATLSEKGFHQILFINFVNFKIVNSCLYSAYIYLFKVFYC